MSVNMLIMHHLNMHPCHVMSDVPKQLAYYSARDVETMMILFILDQNLSIIISTVIFKNLSIILKDS